MGIRGLVGIGETQASPFCVPRKTPEKLLGRLGFRLSKWKDRCVCLRQPLTPSLSTLTRGLEPRHFIQIIKNFQCLVSITKVFTKRPSDCIHLTRLPLQPFCVRWLWVTRITKHQQLLLNKIHHTRIINIRFPLNIFQSLHLPDRLIRGDFENIQ